MASKAVSKVIFAYVMADPFAHLIARHVMDFQSSELVDEVSNL